MCAPLDQTLFAVILLLHVVSSLFCLTLQGRNDDNMPYSSPNIEWQPLETFQSGQEIEINVGMVYYHWVRND